LEATLKVTVPFAVPLAPLVNVSHAVLLAAVHAQPVVVATTVEGEPPLNDRFCAVGVIV